ncbi:hypothetical protein [Nocardioides sp. Iso805N]|uniref:hypothetical protein n=1 Tax=Nocardioides sp. Iso805N TaxID=1283287 RepID=UPI00036B9A7F|nr:hypothetical protein [Nocardioides sp. Iso805N]
MTMTDEKIDQPRRATRTGHRGPLVTARRGLVAGVVIVVLLAVAGWAVARHHGAVGAAPYRDPAAVGALTLCHNGSAVTSGSTTDRPFVTTVVSSQAATGGLATGTTATLYAYQPRQGVGPESWSGLQLGAASSVTDVKAPGAMLTGTDTTLAQFVNAYPAQDGGWVQLRVVLGAPGQAPQTSSYAALDLHIHGSTWTAADPGTATCPSS